MVNFDMSFQSFLAFLLMMIVSLPSVTHDCRLCVRKPMPVALITVSKNLVERLLLLL